MSRRGDNIRKRKDGRWEGRYVVARTSDGITKYRSVYGKTYTECFWVPYKPAVYFI